MRTSWVDEGADGGVAPFVHAWEVLMESRLHRPRLHQSFPSYQWRMVFGVMESASFILLPRMPE